MLFQTALWASWRGYAWKGEFWAFGVAANPRQVGYYRPSGRPCRGRGRIRKNPQLQLQDQLHGLKKVPALRCNEKSQKREGAGRIPIQRFPAFNFALKVCQTRSYNIFEKFPQINAQISGPWTAFSRLTSIPTSLWDLTATQFSSMTYRRCLQGRVSSVMQYCVQYAWIWRLLIKIAQIAHLVGSKLAMLSSERKVVHLKDWRLVYSTLFRSLDTPELWPKTQALVPSFLSNEIVAPLTWPLTCIAQRTQVSSALKLRETWGGVTAAVETSGTPRSPLQRVKM